jgi:hypothetical protein
MDAEYLKAVNKTYDPVTDKHPKEEQVEKVWAEIKDKQYFYAHNLLGQYMIEYNYPVSFVEVYSGSGNDNSETTMTTTTTTTTTTKKKTSYCWSNYYKTIVMKGDAECFNSRYHVDKYHNHGIDDKDENENENSNNKTPFWRTFRDHPNTDKFVSYFTGIKSVPLGPTKWFDLNEDDKLW